MKQKIAELGSYEILESRQVPDLNSYGFLLRHKKTGARLALLSNDDNNKVFYIGFRTPPEDSTGVAHIIEHTVLCGSRNFPVKDPFIELAKGSLNTFLNAMTYPDKTVYPVASCNDKDFQDLMHVYLDAVFYPNIYQEKKIFMQEGWHYDLADLEDDLTINGVVYNEMKGAFSSPDDVLEREVLNSLFPDTAYGTESGGDPEAIPDLTYEAFLDFHKKYYHPSNSYIYLYGDMDMAEKLEFIDKEYLSRFDALAVDSKIRIQEGFAAPKEIRKEYSIMEEESEKNNTYLAYNAVVGDNLDKKLYIAFQVLDYALCSAPGAPLKEALIRQGIGKEIYSTYDNGVMQPYFSIVAKGAEEGQKEEFVRVIEEVLKEQAETGIDRKALKAGLNYFEFKYRESDFGSYPKGLILGLQALDSWLYDDKKPFLHVEANETFGVLKEEAESGYYEDLIRRYLLDNAHKSILVLAPSKGMTARKDAALQKKLQEWKESLGREELEEIIRQTKALEEYQEEPNSKEALARIPLLKREDIKKEAEPYINEEHETADGTLVLEHDIYTNGIAYLRFMFDIGQIPAELFPYIGVLKNVLGMVDTENYAYGDLYHETNIKTGGISIVANTYIDSRNLSEYKVMLEIKAKTLYENIGEAFRLVEEIALRSRFEDKKRLYDVIAELQSRMQATMMSAGHSLAAVRALSYISPTAAVAEQISGIPQYRLLEKLSERFEEEKEDLEGKMTALVHSIFRPENFMLDYTGEKKGAQGIDALVRSFKEKLFTVPVEKKAYRPELSKKNEGYLTSAQVQYVCRAGNFIHKGLSYTGALKVLKVMMGYDYLWNRVRVKGGEADERTMTQFVIGAVSDMDVPMTPAAKGLYSLTGYMTKLPFASVQKERDELLGATAEAIRGLAGHIRAFMEEDCLCVVGSEEKLKENREMFGKLEPLFH